VRQFGEPGIGFASLSETIDTTIAGDTLIFHFMSALVEVERALIRERVPAGIAVERKRGKHVGRLRKLSLEQVAHARDAIDSGGRAG
jgi:DNA invertase Pin-like site-specific DNA recombinase